MRVAVIGAGAAGLTSARYLNSNGHECVIFESRSNLGGTWIYTEDVGIDKYGFPLYSAMYKGLNTNLPKEVMGFPDFPIPDQEKSYLSQSEILNFLNLYADNFRLRELIKFDHHVVDVSPSSNDESDEKWKVSVIDKISKEETSNIFDSVIICNGHYNKPLCPKIIGRDRFKGKQMHSHQYRSAEIFKNQSVLIVGAGPSGLDIALQLSYVTKKLVLSHHSKELTINYPNNVTLKPDVRKLYEYEVEFVDGTYFYFDTILYCTGYEYSFPFLNEKCGVTVEDNYIMPLYKHMINIKKPTMSFIGIPFNVCAFQMFDLQARFYVKYLSGKLKLPKEEEMLKDTEEEIKERVKKGYMKRQFHMMGPDQKNYYDELALIADIIPIDPVIIKLRDESVKRLCADLTNFRKDRYKIIDRETYVKI